MRPRIEIIAVTIAVAGLLTGASRANAQPNAITDRYLTTVQADLNGSLDTKKASVGQQVTVTIRQDTRLANDTELPKGTKLAGTSLRCRRRMRSTSARCWRCCSTMPS